MLAAAKAERCDAKMAGDNLNQPRSQPITLANNPGVSLMHCHMQLHMD
jgi:hypothetical protein